MHEYASTLGKTQGTSQWTDVSVEIHDGMVHWPEDPPVQISYQKHVEWGDRATVSSLSLGSHTGTHVDAPAHVLRGGAGVDALPLDSLMGVARVIELMGVKTITEDDLRKRAFRAGERILFKTTNSDRCWRTDLFVPDYVYLTRDGARYLAERQIRAVGIDYISIGSAEEGPAAHGALLRAGVAVIEGLDLSQVTEGFYDMLCLPLKIRQGDGAPARVLLRRLTAV